MSKFQANGFEIDEDNPQIPLIAISRFMQKMENGDIRYGDQWIKNGLQFLNLMINDLNIPIHILAETDQLLIEEEANG